MLGKGLCYDKVRALFLNKGPNYDLTPVTEGKGRNETQSSSQCCPFPLHYPATLLSPQ